MANRYKLDLGFVMILVCIYFLFANWTENDRVPLLDSIHINAPGGP